MVPVSSRGPGEAPYFMQSINSVGEGKATYYLCEGNLCEGKATYIQARERMVGERIAS